MGCSLSSPQSLGETKRQITVDQRPPLCILPPNTVVKQTPFLGRSTLKDDHTCGISGRYCRSNVIPWEYAECWSAVSLGSPSSFFSHPYPPAHLWFCSKDFFLSHLGWDPERPREPETPLSVRESVPSEVCEKLTVQRKEKGRGPVRRTQLPPRSFRWPNIKQFEQQVK